ncbi:DUF2510 domain-containing protein [Rhodococcoides kyotonense]|nr:DUF2510 domain-containing protein [Rhodococcus kyotonensis]
MDLFQIVVITIVAVVSASVIAGFVVMVVGSERRATNGRAKTSIAPGWYPDAHDETLLRYFDGRVPTQKTAKREVI